MIKPVLCLEVLNKASESLNIKELGKVVFHYNFKLFYYTLSKQPENIIEVSKKGYKFNTLGINFTTVLVQGILQ